MRARICLAVAIACTTIAHAWDYQCCYVLEGDDDCTKCSIGADLTDCIYNGNQNATVELRCTGEGVNRPGWKSIPSDIATLPNLEVLEIENWLLGSLPDELFTLESLRVLKLNNNDKWSTHIDRQSYKFGQFQNLQVLELKGNQRIHGEIPDSLYSLANLQSINFDGSGDVCAPSYFADKGLIAGGDICSGPPSTPPPVTGSPSMSPSPSPTQWPTYSPVAPGLPTRPPVVRTPSPSRAPHTGPTPSGGTAVNQMCDGVFVPVRGKNSSFWATTVLGVISVLFAASGISYILVHRKKTVFAVASPALMITACFELIIFNVAVWLYSYELFAPSNGLCTANGWLALASLASLLCTLSYLFLNTGQKPLILQAEL
mmetsp:Transcript_20750/g.33834  ORF Transcript_20750/g.33834 Transcript_20750/m.33834 type:complete len:373 (-) Transcript_20750:953-2071(-)